MMDLYVEEDLSDECMLSKTKDIGSQNEFGKDDGSDADLESVGKGRNPGMSNTVTEALIRKMGSGGGLEALDGTTSLHDKERFWAGLLEELKPYGDVGAKDTKGLKSRWSNLCAKYKKAKQVSNKSGSGGKKFFFYDLMHEQVGMRPRFTCSALVDSSNPKAITKVNVRQGQLPRTSLPASKCSKTGSFVSPGGSCLHGSGSDSELEGKLPTPCVKSPRSSDEDRRNRGARKTVQERHLSENKKSRKLLEKHANDMSGFMASLLDQGNEMKNTLQKAVTNQEEFNNNFFKYLSSRK